MTLAQAIQKNDWPPADQHRVWAEIELFEALRTSNEARLRAEAGQYWWSPTGYVPYIVSPVPRLISRASANMLFAAAPDIRSDSAQDGLDYLTKQNDLTSELHRAALLSSSEGEVWGRICVQPQLLDVPIIEFVSRKHVIPQFRGRFVTGATFITEWQISQKERLRLLETYEPGVIRSVLYRGDRTHLGASIPLDSFSETKGTRPEVMTGFDYPLCCFIPNTIDGDTTRGYSDYTGLKDRFLGLNRSETIGDANHRLAGRKRAMVDAGYLRDGKLPDGEDIFVMTSRHAGDDAKAHAPLEVIDYRFEAAETVKWIDHMIDTTLQFAGIAPQLLGRGVDNSVISGTALKLKMAHSLMEIAGKGHYFDLTVPKLLQSAMVIDARPTTQDGFGRGYQVPQQLPAFTRVNGIPRDDTEAAQQLSLWVASEAISVEERVTFLHPQWTPQQQAQEVQRIKDEQTAMTDAALGHEQPARLLGGGPGQQH